MSWASVIKGVFGGGGIVSSLERVALECIETNKESAEAKAIVLKVMDPNGKMRRDQSRLVGKMYVFYLVSTAIMLFVELIYSVYMGAELTANDYVLIALNNTTDKMTALFMPITGLFGTIVSLSFGVNYANIKNEK